GRFYACPDRFQLPELSFREPQSSLLPAVQERPLGLERGAETEVVAAFGDGGLPAAGGFVEASLRPGAEVLLRTDGGGPFLAGWDQGAGRVLVHAGQILGPLAGGLGESPAYGAFLARLLRSAAAGRTARAAELALTAREHGVAVVCTLPFGASLPAAPTASMGDATAALAFAGEGRWQGRLAWRGEGPAVVEVRAGGELLAAGATCPPRPRVRRARDHGADLAALALATGGSVAPIGPAGALPAEPPPARAPQPVGLAGPFALAALACFLL